MILIPGFRSWVERPIDGNLTNFIIPEGDLEDLIIISAEDVRNLVFNKIKNISNKYEVKKVIVPFLKIDEDNGKITYLLRCFDGLSKEIINIEISKESDIENFGILLFDILNSFTISYDDYWVLDNLKKNGVPSFNRSSKLYTKTFKNGMLLKILLEAAIM